MEIRSANEDDLTTITDLIVRCSKQFILPDFPEEGVNAYMTSHSLEKMRERLLTMRYQVLCDKNGKVIGTVGMQSPSHLYHLHVEPKLHGKGYGRLLWNAAKTAAIQQDQPVKFTVNSSTFAVPFYEKLGFVPSNRQTMNGVTFVPMTMDLETSGC